MIGLLTLSLNLGASVWQGSSESWSQGDGSEESPYLIEKPEHLAYLSQQVYNGETFEGQWFRQTTDFDMNSNNSYVFTPIGFSETQVFKGNYDGGNYSISNLRITYANNPTYCALFGYSENAIFKNIVIQNIDFASNEPTYISSVVAYMKNGTLDNCVNNAPLTIATNCTYVGGLVAYMLGDCSCNNSKNYGSISISGKCFYVGGIVSNINGSCSINQCSNEGDIIVTSTNTNEKVAQVGGLCGLHESGALSILKSFNTGNISLTLQIATYSNVNPSSSIGGLVGYANGCSSLELTASYCRSYFVSSTNFSNQYSYTPTGSPVAMCGDENGQWVRCKRYTHTYQYAGGIIGRISCSSDFTSNINQCFFSGEIMLFDIGTNKSYLRCAGLIGYIQTTNSSQNNINNSYAVCNLYSGVKSARQNMPAIPIWAIPSVIDNPIDDTNTTTITPGSTTNQLDSRGYSVNVVTVSNTNYYTYSFIGDLSSTAVSTSIASMNNCYFAGTLNSFNKLLGISYNTSLNSSNNYFLESCGATSTYAQALSDEEMKSNSFPQVLNNNGNEIFFKDEDNINDGYPIFYYQLNKTPQYTVTLLTDETKGSVSGSGTYDEGTEIEISATPQSGYEFTKWSDGNEDNPRTITVNENIELTALWKEESIEEPQCMIASGELTDAIAWQIDCEGTLLISGIGLTPDWAADNLTSRPWNAYINSIKTVEFNEGITTIGAYMLAECNNISAVTFSNSIISIGANAFYRCSALSSVQIPDNVMTIGENAFGQCRNIASLTIGNGVIFIGTRAFCGLQQLTSINIPASVSSIGVALLSQCGQLSTITVDQNNSIYDSRNDCNAIIQTATNTLIAGCSETDIPDDIVTIGQYAFESCFNLQNILIPNSVQLIQDYAFSNCGNLQIISCMKAAPPSATPTTFFNLQKESIFLQVPCNAIEAYTNSNEWKDFSIIESDKASGLCGAGVECGNTNMFWSINCNNVLFIGGEGEMMNFNNISCSEDMWHNHISEINTLIIEDGVNTIGNNAFTGCTSLRKATLGNGINVIGAMAFYNCTALDTLVFTSQTAPTISGDAFDNTHCVFIVPCGSKTDYTEALAVTESRIIEGGEMPYHYSVTTNDETKGNVSIITEPTFCNNRTLKIAAQATDLYQFNRWSDGNTDATRIIILNKDTNLVAEFGNKKYTVSFVDYDGRVIKTQQVERGNSAKAPSHPNRDGWLFTGWDKNYDNITSDLTVTAKYIQLHSGTDGKTYFIPPQCE